MKPVTKGVLASIVLSITLTFISFIVGVIVAATAENSWNGLTTSMFILIFSGIIIVLLLVIGIIKYRKNQSKFILGAVYGFTGVIIFVAIIPIVTALFGLIMTVIG